MNIPAELFYTEDHEWIMVDGDEGTIGLTDYAQEQLGDIVYVELPDVDEEINAGEEVAAIESVKAASDVYMPVSGVVTEVNEELLDEPGAINADAFKAWVVKIQITDPEEIEELMSAVEYEAYIAEEA